MSMNSSLNSNFSRESQLNQQNFQLVKISCKNCLKLIINNAILIHQDSNYILLGNFPFVLSLYQTIK